MNRTPTLAATLVVAALLAAACSGGDDADSTDATSTTSASSTTEAPTTTTPPTTSTSTLPPITTTTLPDIPRMPLTGEPIASDAAIPDRPALAVKTSNYPRSVVPQAGLNRADIVIEEIINDGATRLAAIFHSQGHDPVGPVRSGRAQDINLLQALNHPLFAWSGGNPAVTRAVRDSELVDLSAIRTSGYYRRQGRVNPNDLYSSTDVLWSKAPEDAAPPPVVFPYLREGQELTGSPAAEIELSLDTLDARWEYDAESGRYYRWQNGDEHTTEDNGSIEQVWADNVVVMLADYGRNQFDGNPDAQVLGTNPVFVFTGGTVRSGSWLRFSSTDRFGFFDTIDDLNELGLQPGRTWLEIPRNDGESLSWS